MRDRVDENVDLCNDEDEEENSWVQCLVRRKILPKEDIRKISRTVIKIMKLIMTLLYVARSSNLPKKGRY